MLLAALVALTGLSVLLTVRGGFGRSAVNSVLVVPTTLDMVDETLGGEDYHPEEFGPDGNGGMNMHGGGTDDDGGAGSPVDKGKGDNDEDGWEAPTNNNNKKANQPVGGKKGGPKSLSSPLSKDEEDVPHHKVLGEQEYADGAPMGRSTTRSWPPTSVMPVEEVRKYFKDTLLIIMMSPPRYHLVNEVKKHYVQYFQHVFFCGPRNNSDFGVDIRGYDIVYGNEQYRAVNRILREHYMNTSEKSSNGKVAGKLRGAGAGAEPEGERWKVHLGSGNASFPIRHMTPDKATITGMLYVSDDVIMQPWSLAARGLNLKIPWTSQMGIANTDIDSWIDLVPGASILEQHRPKWHFWTKHRHTVMAAIKAAEEPFRYRLALAAAETPLHIHHLSKYQDRQVTKEQDAEDEKLWNYSKPYIRNYRYLKWAAFFTTVDSYYVPRSMWGDYCEASDLMARFHVGLEVGVATMLRILHPVSEDVDIQYYWSSPSAADCHRMRWEMQSGGIHRCQHDHRFVQYIFSNDTIRNAILANRNGEVRYAHTVEGLIDVPYEALNNTEKILFIKPKKRR